VGLDLYLNHLSGTIPNTLGNLHKLHFLYDMLSLFSYLWSAKFIYVGFKFFLLLPCSTSFFVFPDAKCGRIWSLYNKTITYSAKLQYIIFFPFFTISLCIIEFCYLSALLLLCIWWLAAYHDLLLYFISCILYIANWLFILLSKIGVLIITAWLEPFPFLCQMLLRCKFCECSSFI